MGICVAFICFFFFIMNHLFQKKKKIDNFLTATLGTQTGCDHVTFWEEKAAEAKFLPSLLRDSPGVPCSPTS